MTFEQDGKIFEATKNYLRVDDKASGKNLLTCFDVFRKEPEDKEIVVKAYNTMQRIFNEEYNRA